MASFIRYWHIFFDYFLPIYAESVGAYVMILYHFMIVEWRFNFDSGCRQNELGPGLVEHFPSHSITSKIMTSFLVFWHIHKFYDVVVTVLNNFIVLHYLIAVFIFFFLRVYSCQGHTNRKPVARFISHSYDDWHKFGVLSQQQSVVLNAAWHAFTTLHY